MHSDIRERSNKGIAPTSHLGGAMQTWCPKGNTATSRRRPRRHTSKTLQRHQKSHFVVGNARILNLARVARKSDSRSSLDLFLEL